MLGRQTATAHYWTKSLKISDSDMESIFAIMLEEEKPLDGRQMARLFVERRVRQEDELWRKRLKDGKLYQPRETYEIGQKLVFPALKFALGEVMGARPGSNPDQGQFTVIQVAFDDGVQREFASALATPHQLDLSEDVDGGESASLADQVLEPADIDAILEEHGAELRKQIEARLEKNDDVAYAAGLWFVTSLLPQIDEGHLNLAEALLDMQAGGPLSAEEMLPILDLPREINQTLQAFALNYAMYNDRRFDEVGAEGMVRWYLRALEPEEVKQTPERLVYDPIPYNRDLLTPEELELEAEIADEHSELPAVTRRPEQVTLTLIYPHRRSGTLPLNSALSAMFPTAYEAERILVTFVDEETEDEYTGWVVRAGRYICGLDRLYRKNKLPIGTIVRIRRTADPVRFIIGFDAYRPRTEWVTLLQPQGTKITFESDQRAIGAVYDELIVLGVDDLAALDAIRTEIKRHKRGLVEIVRELLPELARLNPQGAVHFKTLYSAVNMVRRCPPGPVFAALESQPVFEPVGGHYWRMSNRDA